MAMEQEQGGGVSQTIADVNSGLMKVMEAVQGQYPEIAEKLGAVIQGYQGIVEELMAPSDAGPKQEAMPANVPPEAGAAKVQPVL